MLYALAVEIHAHERVLVHVADAEAHRHLIRDAVGVNGHGHGIAHAALGFQCDLSAAIRRDLTAHEPRRRLARFRGFLGNVVHQIVHMEHVAAGEHAGDIGLQAFIDDGAARHGAELYARGGAQLVLRDQTAGEQEGVAGVALLGALDGSPVSADLGDRDRRDVLLALDVHDRVAESERNAEVIETLHDVALEAAGIGHQLRDELHLRALQGHAARHDQTDIA